MVLTEDSKLGEKGQKNLKDKKELSDSSDPEMLECTLVLEIVESTSDSKMVKKESTDSKMVMVFKFLKTFWKNSKKVVFQI